MILNTLNRMERCKQEEEGERNAARLSGLHAIGLEYCLEDGRPFIVGKH